MTTHTTARPDFDWNDAFDCGAVAFDYVDADLVADALDAYWDDRHLAAAYIATIVAPDTTWHDMCRRNDDDTLNRALAEAGRHGGFDGVASTWDALTAHVIYWACYDEAIFDIDATIARVTAALASGELAAPATSAVP